MSYRIFFLVLITNSLLFGVDWKPVTPEQLSLKTPKVEANADAEAIFWQVAIHDDPAGNGYLNHIAENYIRIKLYNARAVEKFGNVEIPYFSELKMSVTGIRGRTIKPDGSIIDLPGNEITERTTAKLKRANVKVKAFAFKGLEPGAIIEYQWIEVHSEYVPRYTELPMQREIPIWDVTYQVRPFTSFSMGERMASYPFNCQPTPWEPVRGDVSRGGYVWTSVKNMKAFVEEPYMPSEDNAKAWVLIYYAPPHSDKPAAYWPSKGKQLYSEFRKSIKINDEIKKLANEVAGSETSPFAKAFALSEYCQKNIANVSYNGEGMTNEIRRKFFEDRKDSYNTTDTLKSKVGTARDITALFFAMAEAAGLNPVYVRGGSSQTAMFRADFLDSYLLRNTVVAIREGDEAVRYYNPGIYYSQPGMLDIDEQGQAGLFVDPKNPKLILIANTPPDRSVLRRNADLTINDEGTITGKVSISFGGHFAMEEKLRLDGVDRAPAEERLRKRFEAQYPGAKLTNFKIEDANKPIVPLKVSFDIEMENYGQRTGKRMFFQPAFFQFAERPLFTASTRTQAMYFPYAYTEDDLVVINYPITYALDSAELPGSIKLGDIGNYQLSGASVNGKPQLRITHKMLWGASGGNYIEAQAYPAVKQAWDMINKANTTMLTLKVKE